MFAAGLRGIVLLQSGRLARADERFLLTTQTLRFPNGCENVGFDHDLLKQSSSSLEVRHGRFSSCDEPCQGVFTTVETRELSLRKFLEALHER